MSISGNAGAWWGNAAGRYSRGNTPVTGSVLVFKPSGAMRLGHVAVVSHVVNKREILVDQANWVPGRVVKDMAVYDVSADNNWSAVRVADYRSTNWGRINPTFGFIYPIRRAPAEADIVEADYRPDQKPHTAAVRLADYQTVQDTERAHDRRLVRAPRRTRHEAAPEHARRHDEHEAKAAQIAALRDRKAKARRHEDRVASAQPERVRKPHETKVATRRDAPAPLHHREPARLAAASAHDKPIARRERHLEPHIAVAEHRRSHPAVRIADRAEHAHPAERHVAKSEHPAVRSVRHVAARQHPAHRPEQIAEARTDAN